MSEERETNHIYQGDCVDVMRTFPEGVIDLHGHFPHYDNLRAYKGYEFNFEKSPKSCIEEKGRRCGCLIVADATVKGNETGTSFRQALYFKEIGFNLHDTMIWRKPNAMPQIAKNVQQFEYMFVFSNSKTTNA